MYLFELEFSLDIYPGLGLVDHVVVLSRRLSGKESACQVGDAGSIPGSERFPGEGNGNPLQYSCLGNPLERGAWQATVHGVTKELNMT